MQLYRGAYRLISLTAMRIFLFILFIVSVAFTQAQSRWLESAGSQANDEALDLTVDNNGNIFTTGYFSFSSKWSPSSASPIIKNSKGFDDIFISKQNSQGGYQWVQTAGGNSPDRAYAITKDKWGNVYVTGYFSGTASFGSFSISATNTGNDIDVFVAKLDANGNFLWAKSFGGADAEIGYGITTDFSGNVIFCGQFKNTFSIGSSTFTSMINPITNSFSHDIFIAKLDSSGNVLWAKQGAAKYNDRGIDVSVDSKNNIYMVGEFSDTLTFTNTYNNSVYGSGYLIKLDSSGNEIWFRKMSATQSLSYGIESDSLDQIYVAGEFKGQLGIFSPSPVFLNIPYNNGIFITKMDTAGNVVWLKGDGSNNFVTATNLALDANGQPYMVGMYKCRMDEYSSLYGNGIFYSAGYRDIFIVKYSDTGIRQWVRSFGGPLDDYSSAIGLVGVDRPVIAGSYEDNFYVPGNYSFLSQVGTLNGAQCGDQNYGRYALVSSLGNKDIFYADPIDLSREPYDYFTRVNGSGCFLDSLKPCIMQCQDSIQRCFSAYVCLDTKTTAAGPYYTYKWNTGDTSSCIKTNVSGQFIINVDREDGCWKNFKDTINVTIHPLPPTPKISDDVVINTNTSAPKVIKVCAPDTVNLWTTNHQPGDSITWQGPNFFSNDTLVSITKSGIYTVSYITPYGCSSFTRVELYFDDFAISDTLNPYLIFNSTPYHQDSIELCSGDPFLMTLIDSAFISQNGWKIPYKWVLWSVTNGLFMLYDSTHANYNASSLTHQHTNSFSTSSSGWYTVTANLINICNNDTSYYPISKTIYITVNPKPSLSASIVGSSLICPGDTAMLIANYTGNFKGWSGSSIISPFNKDTVYINGPGYYSFSVDSVSQFGCLGTASASLTVSTKPAPIIYSIPANAIICPNDSVQLLAPNGLSWQWVGPGGVFVGNTQNIYATVPGFYYCIVTDLSGCTMISNFIELKDYQTPYLVAFPGNTICANGIIKIQVQTVDSSLIVWNPPLSGGGATQFVSGPGVYSCSVTLCGITTNLSITITPSNTQAQITVQGSLPMCAGDTVILYANSGMQTYQWTPGGQVQQQIFVTKPGTYHVQVMDQFGCYAGDTVTISQHPITPKPIVKDTTICSPASVTITASGSGTINWYSQQFGGSPISTGSNYTTTVISATTTYWVENIDNTTSCASERVPVKVILSPVMMPANISGDSVVCEGNKITLFANNISGAFYSWTGPNGFTSNQQNFTLSSSSLNQQGWYYVTVSDSFCSGPLDSFLVIVNPKPIVKLKNPGVHFICPGDSLQIFADTINGGTYTWYGWVSSNNNVVVDSTGIYSVSFTDVNGCIGYSDSAIVNYYPPGFIISQTDTTICKGSSIMAIVSSLNNSSVWKDSTNQVVWTGDTLMLNNIQNDLSFTVYQIDSNGCSSPHTIYNVHVTFGNYAGIVSADTLVCKGGTANVLAAYSSGLSYSWIGPNGFASSNNSFSINNFTFSDTGYYFLSVFDGNCVYRDSVFIKVIALPKIKLYPGGNVSICPGDSLLITTDTLTNGFYLWTNGDTMVSTVVTNAGSYFVGFYTAYGCYVISDTLNVSVSPTPKLSYLSNDTVICSASSVTLSAIGNGPITWFDSSGSQVGGGSTYITPTISQNTFFLVQMMDSVTGCKSVMDSVFIYYLPSNLMPPIYGDTSLCVGDSLKLWTINYPNAQFFWTTPQGPLSNYLIAFSNVTPAYSGNYSLYVTSGACTSLVNSVNVTVYNNPPTPVLSISDTVCQGSTIFLSTPFLQNSSYNWVGPNYSSNNPTDSVINAQYFDRGYYILELTQNGCRTKDSAFVEVIGIPGYSVSASSPICEGDDIFLLATFASGATYSWTGPNGFSSNLFNPTIQNSSPSNNGLYVVTTNYLGCSIGPDSIFVKVDKKPVLNLPYDTTFCYGLSIQLSATPGYQNYLWNTGDTSAQITVSDSGVYYVFIVNGSCYVYDSTVVHLKNCPSISANIFTPNGDGFNDFFKIDSPGATRIMCTIYNRWGDIIYKWNDVNGYWDGNTLLNIEAAEGVYFYVAEIKNMHGIEEIIKGFVHLNR